LRTWFLFSFVFLASFSPQSSGNHPNTKAL
jgi:hypothetical protein